MFETLKNAFKIKEVRRKIFFTVLLILVYRVGCFIPVPGINSSAFESAINGNTFLGIMNTIGGGSLSNGTLLAMGITPYINASIIMQLLSIAIPALERLSKQGEEGKKKIAQYTRYLTLLLAIVQAVGILLSFGNVLDTTILGESLNWLLYIFIIVIYTAGTAFTMWLGERITENGIGNGMSLIIFVGILATAGTAIYNQIAATIKDINQIWSLIGFLVAIVLIFTLIVFVDLAERKIPVQYAKQIKGRKMYGGQSTNIPIRVNASGVMPLIFAFAIVSFPGLIINLFWPNSNASMGVQTWFSAVSPYPFYIITLGLLIVFFAYFYAQIQFNPDDISRNIQQYGGFIPGIRPGKPTSDYLRKISNRITLFGALFLALIAIVPTYVFALVTGANAGLMNAFSATGMLIVVSVALEFDKQLESQIMMRHYKGFMK